ncbi:MAG: HAD-IA family hydrolase [Zoogloeaceae bacterium]|jgi:phosphoglycolate phosphatase|nr:HAD-IA family hydrolase [Zoogloeaceae bacterium]
MDKRFELIVFDWDGTLLDSAGRIVTCIQTAAADLGLPPPSDEQARRVIGLGLHEALRNAMPELEPNHYDELAGRYRHYYLSSDHELPLFNGAAELVRDLAAKGYRLAVATGKSRKGLDRAFAASGLGHYFHASRCADECHSKPHPQMLEELMDELDAPPDATLMIGDTTYDLQMATNAGIGALAVAYGAHPREMLAEMSPLYCADSLADLTDWLRRHG